MPTLEDAIALALNAHQGQVDKVGYPPRLGCVDETPP